MVTSGLHTKAQTRGQPREGGREPEDVHPQCGPQRRGAGGRRTDGAGGLEDVVSGRGGCDLHAQGGRAVQGSERGIRCAHCQIDREARGGVIAVYACAREEGCIAQDR